MSSPFTDPFSVSEREEAGVRVIAVAGELDIATASEVRAHESGLAALRLS